MRSSFIKKYSLLTIGFVLQNLNLVAQNQHQSNQTYKHQLGIGLTQFVNFIFNDDPNAFLINYRQRYNNKIYLRLGVDFFMTDEDGGEYVYGAITWPRQSFQFL